MTIRFTPGPWRATDESNGLVVSAPGVCFVADCRKAFRSDSETQDLVPPGERAANARLVAAAPAMLEAIEEFESALARSVGFDPVVLARAIGALRDAGKAARGDAT